MSPQFEGGKGGGDWRSKEVAALYEALPLGPQFTKEIRKGNF